MKKRSAIFRKPGVEQSPLIKFGAVLGLIALALVITKMLGPLAEQNQFVLFALAVMLASWYAGLWAGLLATVLAAITINHAFMPPPYWLDFKSTDLPRLGLFVSVAMIVSWLNGSRQEAEDLLRQSEEHFRSLVEGVQDYAIFKIDPDGRVLSWNTTAQRISGYAAEQIVGQNFACLLPPEDVREGKPRRLLSTAGAMNRVEDEDWRVRLDGTRYWALTIITALRDDEGKLRGFSHVMRDMTQRRREQELARQQEMELARLSRLTTLNELASGIAHELNQPLSAVTLYSQGCLEKLSCTPGIDPEVVEAMRQVTVQAERAAAIVDHFRKLINKREDARVPIQVGDMAQAALELLQADIRRCKVTLKTELAADMPAVSCNQIAIEQVLVNLIKNAVEAMQGCPPPRELTVQARLDDDNRVAVAVMDTGPGLPATSESLFAPFFTTKKDGLGMGLTISRTIIESHGGHLGAASRPDGGAVFYFVLPQAQAEESKRGNDEPESDGIRGG